MSSQSSFQHRCGHLGPGPRGPFDTGADIITSICGRCQQRSRAEVTSRSGENGSILQIQINPSLLPRPLALPSRPRRENQPQQHHPRPQPQVTIHAPLRPPHSPQNKIITANFSDIVDDNGFLKIRKKKLSPVEKAMTDIKRNIKKAKDFSKDLRDRIKVTGHKITGKRHNDKPQHDLPQKLGTSRSRPAQSKPAESRPAQGRPMPPRPTKSSPTQLGMSQPRPARPTPSRPSQPAGNRRPAFNYNMSHGPLNSHPTSLRPADGARQKPTRSCAPTVAMIHIHRQNERRAAETGQRIRPQTGPSEFQGQSRGNGPHIHHGQIPSPSFRAQPRPVGQNVRDLRTFTIPRKPVPSTHITRGSSSNPANASIDQSRHQPVVPLRGSGMPRERTQLFHRLLQTVQPLANRSQASRQHSQHRPVQHLSNFNSSPRAAIPSRNVRPLQGSDNRSSTPIPLPLRLPGNTTTIILPTVPTHTPQSRTSNHRSPPNLPPTPTLRRRPAQIFTPTRTASIDRPPPSGLLPPSRSQSHTGVIVTIHITAPSASPPATNLEVRFSRLKNAPQGQGSRNGGERTGGQAPNRYLQPSRIPVMRRVRGNQMPEQRPRIPGAPHGQIRRQHPPPPLRSTVSRRIPMSPRRNQFHAFTSSQPSPLPFPNHDSNTTQIAYPRPISRIRVPIPNPQSPLPPLFFLTA